MEKIKYLAFAVGYRRVSLVLLQNGRLVTWQTSCKAASNDRQVTRLVNDALNTLVPHVIVFEKIGDGSRKGKNATARLKVIAELADSYPAQVLCLERERLFASRFQEAEHLASRYPELADKVPYRRFFDREPHHVVLFEALALADQAMHGSSRLLASNM